jgi:hypothetical protein
MSTERAEHDDTDAYRRRLQAALNAAQAERQALEERYGQVWSTDELGAAFEVLGFAAPLVIVERKADGVKGSLLFQHHPRYYWGWKEDTR